MDKETLQEWERKDHELNRIHIKQLDFVLKSIKNHEPSSPVDRDGDR